MSVPAPSAAETCGAAGALGGAGDKDWLCCLALLWGEYWSTVEIGLFWLCPHFWEVFVAK